MPTEGARTVAYADLVGGLLDARVDPATDRFDAELAAAVAAGTLTQGVARTLRFWQRASVRGLVEHARNVLPAALAALDAAREESQDTIDADGRSWEQATTAATAATEADATDEPEPTEPTGRTPSIDLNQPSSRLIVAGLTQVTIGNEPAH